MRRGFTLTEILVVIVLIILLLGMAVPVFSLIKGSRSVDGAENQISALIGRARTDAIGLGTPHGVIFFLDPNSGATAADQRVSVAEVESVDPPAGSPRDVYLDRVADTDHLLVPAGVMVMMLNNGTIAGNPAARTSDGYIGYNNNVTVNAANQTAGTFIGGVILFGGNGELISRTWGYYVWDATNGRATAIASELNLPATAAAPFIESGPTPTGTGGVVQSSLGFVLFDAAAFKNKGNVEDPQLQPSGVYSANNNAEQAEEQWIDDNSTPLLVNRFNGTLVRGE